MIIIIFVITIVIVIIIIIIIIIVYVYNILLKKTLVHRTLVLCAGRPVRKSCAGPVRVLCGDPVQGPARRFRAGHHKPPS